MNRLSILLVGLLMFTLRLSFAQTTETEPNDSFTQANSITLGTSLKITINPLRDVDYFKITLTKPGVVEVAAQNIPSSIGIGLELFNSDNQSLGTASYDYGKNAFLNVQACASGVYYVLVKSGTFLFSNSTTAFDLTVKLNDTDPFECNNSFLTAKEISSSLTTKIAIFPDRDVDYFKVAIKKPGVLELSAENVPDNIAVGFEVYNSANQLIGSGGGDAGKNAYFNILTCDLDVYYIVVKNTTFLVNSNPILFDFKVNLNNSDAYECNNTFNSAKEIKSGLVTKIAIFPDRDVDYFKLVATKPGVIDVTAENIPSNIALGLEIYNSANQLINNASYDAGKNAYISTLICDPGSYYILLKNTTFLVNSNRTLFDFKVKLDTTDIYECNNSFVAAKDIQVDNPIKAAINARGDVDFFKFTLATKTTLNLTVDDVPATLAMSMVVYNGSQNQIQSASGNVGTAFAIRKYALEAGTYYVRLAGNGYDAKLYTFGVARDTLLPPKLSANTLSVCPGGEARLTATECTGTVRWSTSQTGLTITVKPTAATNYTAVCEDGGRTSQPSVPLTISMKTVPTASATASTNGNYYETQTIQLAATGGGTYLWQGPNNYASSSQNPSIANAKAGMSGDYVVRVTNTESCTASASVKITVSIITGIEPDENGIGLTVSPNPVSNDCTVKLSLEKPAPVVVRLLTTTGREVRQWVSGKSTRFHETTLTLTDLPAGLYIIQVKANDKTASEKLLKN